MSQTTTPVTRFKHHPSRPKHEATRAAYSIICYAHQSASSFLQVFETLRGTRKAKGTSTDEEQDLLRAMVMFASAGLDSMAKQLITDTLSLVIGRHEGAHALFREFVERKIIRQDRLDAKFLAGILTSRAPQESMVNALVRELTDGSLQSRDALLRAAAHFDIPSKALCSDLDALHKTFQMRNEIAHEMDIDFAHPNRNRFSRRKADMVSGANTLFSVSDAFLREVDSRLSS